jgi:hypothetical protein
MAYSSQQPTLLNHRGSVYLIIAFPASQDLQRDLAIELRVPGSINIAKRASAHVLDDFERTPIATRNVRVTWRSRPF